MIEWGTKGRVSTLLGGQFGSEGKGLFSAYLAGLVPDLDIATANAGAQAGHTTSYADGRKFICFHLPTAGVVAKNALSYINAGAIIDPGALIKELRDVNIDPKRVYIHPRAAIITDKDRADEKAHGSSTEKLASTQKGVGAAIANKVMRRATLAAEINGDPSWIDPRLWALKEAGVKVEALDLNYLLSLGHSIQMEVPQGMDLSLNHGLAYPYTTSRDCYINSGLSDAGIHPRFVGPTAMIVRTFPIRVGAIYNEQGEKLGDSGPFYPDSDELDWAKNFPDIEPERTTVTKRVRRIATFSIQQYRHALGLNQPTIVALNFCNYLPDHLHLTLLVQRMERAHDDMSIHPQMLFGFGPNCEDVTDSFASALRWYDTRSFK